MEHAPIVPAGAPLESLDRFLALGIPAAPLIAVARALSRFGPAEIGAAIEVLIALQDFRDGDTEAEDDDPAEAAGDEHDAAWIEWKDMHPAKRPGPNAIAGAEDDEEDDPSGQCDEDGVNTALALASGNGPGCVISDSDKGIEDDPHDQEHDAEVEQMVHDVPALPVHTAEYNVFNDQRTHLGRSNLMTSFRTNGGEERSADTGALHRLRGDAPHSSGVPV